MIPLCRHILHGGLLCQQAAVKETYFCRHHQNQNAMAAEIKPTPDPYGIHTPLPFVFPEDHAAIQTNFFIVVQALNGNRINIQKANAFNRLFRSCELNLNKMEDRMEALEAKPERVAQRVILTPEGEEIASPREALEEGELQLHHKGCPCQHCAEEFRGAPPEQHHADCKCGLCKPVTAAESGEQSDSGDLRPRLREANASELHTYELTDSVNEETNFFNDIYREHIAKHKVQYAERARAAIEAGLEPPPYEPFDPDKIEPQAERLYKETMEQVEKNREAARQTWNRLHPDRPVEYTPYVSWADEEELRREQWKKAREAGEASSRAASEAPMADVSLPAS